jgi:Bacterial archaeo-eukaryotic release factor family 10
MAELSREGWRDEPPDDAMLHALAQPDGRPAGPVISMYLQTDPRVAANAAQTPAWMVAARNGLRDVSAELEAGEDRDAKMAWRDRRAEIETELERLLHADRGRSLVWFMDLGGDLDVRYVLQVPVRESAVTMADQPVIAPLIELLDHSRPVGIVLVSGERVRLVHWAHGRIDEAGEEVFEVDGDGWRPYRGPSSATPGRGGRSGVTHTENVEQRMEEHRDRFFATAAAATAERLSELGWSRIVIAAERAIAHRFRNALPHAVQVRVVAELAMNAVDAHESEIAQRLEPAIEELHTRDALAAVNGMQRFAKGPAAVLAALAQGQVDHLVLDPHHRPSDTPLPDIADQVLRGARFTRAPERAIEAAIAADAVVTTLSTEASPDLQEADGMMAGLRW